MSKLEDEKKILQSHLVSAENHIENIERELKNLTELNKELQASKNYSFDLIDVQQMLQSTN